MSKSDDMLREADEIVSLFLSESQPLPMLPIEGHDAWTDWVTMVLKNCGAWQVRRRAGL